MQQGVFIYESNRNRTPNRRLRYNNTKRIMPHKHWGFADFVQELDSRPGHNSTLICPKGGANL